MDNTLRWIQHLAVTFKYSNKLKEWALWNSEW